MHWSAQFINQSSKFFEQNFSILKCHCIIYLLDFLISKYSFYRRIIQVCYQYFQTCLVLSFLINVFSTALALPALIVLKTLLKCSTRGLCSNLLEQFPKSFQFFYFPFSQFPTKISSTFFLKFAICLVIPELLLNSRCFNP